MTIDTLPEVERKTSAVLPEQRDEASIAADLSLSQQETPGELLRQAREALGKTPFQIADKLHLSEAWIQAIERNDFSMARARIYATGYLRHYAEVVGVPVDKVISSFERLGWDAPSAPHRPLTIDLPSHFKKRAHARLAKKHTGKIIVGTVLIAAAIVLALNGKTWLGNKAAVPNTAHTLMTSNGMTLNITTAEQK